MRRTVLFDLHALGALALAPSRTVAAPQARLNPTSKPKSAADAEKMVASPAPPGKPGVEEAASLSRSAPSLKTRLRGGRRRRHYTLGPVRTCSSTMAASDRAASPLA